MLPQSIMSYNVEDMLDHSPKMMNAVRRLEDRIDRSAAAVTESLVRHQLWYIAIFSIAYFLLTIYRAQRKLFWFDEICTIYVCQLRDMKAIWEGLVHGVDFNPPLLYALTRASQALFGESQLSARLPEIVGFWIFCLCIFRFVSIAVSPVGGFAAMLLPMASRAYYYAYEARAHALVMGFCGLAVVCWQSAIAVEKRAWRLIGLSASLGAALLTHPYAILLVTPLALGEAVRSFRLRRLDWPVWIALAAPAPAILVSIPLLHALASLVGTSYLRVSITAPFNTYVVLFAPAALPLVGLVILFSIDRMFGGHSISLRFVVPHEFAFATGFLLLPLVGFLLSTVMRGPYTDRYMMTLIVGVSYFLGVATAGVSRSAALGIIVLLLAGIALDASQFIRGSYIIESSSDIRIATRTGDSKKAFDLLATRASGDLPIVLLDNFESFPLAYYAPPELARRMFVLFSPADTIGAICLRIKQWCNPAWNVEGVSDFLASHDSFFVYGSISHFSGVLPHFLDAGVTLTVKAYDGQQMVMAAVKPNRITRIGNRPGAPRNSPP